MLQWVGLALVAGKSVMSFMFTHLGPCPPIA